MLEWEDVVVFRIYFEGKARFADELDKGCEQKRGFKDDSQTFV